MSSPVAELQKHRISLRNVLAVVQGLLLAALCVVAGLSWIAIDNSNRFARELALVGRAQRYYQQADTMQDALRADVNSALSVESTDPDAAEVILASMRANAARFTAALDALRQSSLPDDLQHTVASTRTLADAYIARATALTAIAVRNRERAGTLKAKFDESFNELRETNIATSTLFAQHTEAAEARATRATATAKQCMVAAAAVIAVCGGIFLLLGRSMRRSLRQVRDVARALAQGNLTVRVVRRGADEIGELAQAVNKMADDLQGLIDRLRAEADRDTFGAQLVEALEMSDSESEVHVVVGRAMAQVSADLPMELLLSDSSRAHLERAAEHPKAGAPGCTVESPFSCIAVRRGNPVVFEDSEALNSCPRLRERACGAVSAVCVPVSFMGRSLGVLHTTAPARQAPSPEQVAQLRTLGMQLGSRIGTVRAFERTQHQASTDSLTGLKNRRSLAEVVRELAAAGTPYAFVLADLDHFKRLNDSHGHEAGDKALRLFSDVFKKALRDADVAARWGGEEFAALLPSCMAADAHEVIERLRADLVQALVVSSNPPFTASFGIADASMGARFEDVVRVADEALYRSKEGGRDRATMGDPTQLATAKRRSSEHRASIDVRMLANQS
ncbi:MAG: diguanylate cyclase domain-containing protein [Steroidobacteraceae bacterium]